MKKLFKWIRQIPCNHEKEMGYYGNDNEIYPVSYFCKKCGKEFWNYKQ